MHIDRLDGVREKMTNNLNLNLSWCKVRRRKDCFFYFCQFYFLNNKLRYKLSNLRKIGFEF